MHGVGNGIHRVKTIIDRYLLIPSYVGLIGSMVLRGMIAASTAYFDYEHVVPLLIRAAIEIGMIAGIIASSEIITSSAAANIGELNRALRDVARMKLRGKTADQAMQRLTLAAAITEERRGYFFAAVFASSLSVAYGIVFESAALHNLTWQSVVIAIIGLIAPPFGIYQFSANYKPPTEDPRSEAIAGARHATHQLIKGALTAIESGTYDNTHVHVLQRGLEGEEQGMLSALLRSEGAGRIYTTADIYAMFGIADPSAKRAITRRLETALKQNTLGVAKDPENGKWLIAGGAVLTLFEDMISLNDKARQPLDRKRTKRADPVAVAATDVRHATDASEPPAGLNAGEAAQFLFAE